MAAKPYLSALIPVYNEEENLARLGEEVSGALSGIGKPYEVILVDDGSVDGSFDELMKLVKKYPGFKVVRFARNAGQTAAMLAGIQHASGELIVCLDADMQNDARDVPKLIAKLNEGYDCVSGWRKSRQDRFLDRKLPSMIANGFISTVTGVKLHDYGCMLRGYSREVVDAMLLCKERHSFIPALANSFAKRITEVPVAHAERAAGDSKYGFWKLINLQFDLLTSFSLLPLQMLSVLGVLVSALGMGFGVYLLGYRVLHPDRTVEGVFTLFAILFIFIGAQFLAFGLLGEYIGRIYVEVRDRPR